MAQKANANLPRGIFQKESGAKIYYIQFTDAAGRRRREKAGTYKMAEDLLLLRHMERLRRKMPGSKGRYGVKVGDLIDDAINYAFSNNDPVAAHDLRLKMERIRETFGTKEASTVTRQQISDWLDAETVVRKWKPSTRNRYQSAFSLMFRLGIEHNKIEFNPASGIKKRQEDNGVVRLLSRDEEQAMRSVLQGAYDPAHYHAFVLSLHTGMRRSEQERSLVGDYDPNTGLIVRQKKNKRSPSVRYVPMTPIAVEAYNQLAAGKKPGDSLCKAVMEDIRWFDRVVESAGVIGYTWHCNRHTFCSRLVMTGTPIPAVAGYAGHANIQMTLRYSHLIPRANEQAIASMMSFYEQPA